MSVFWHVIGPSLFPVYLNSQKTSKCSKHKLVMFNVIWSCPNKVWHSIPIQLQSWTLHWKFQCIPQWASQHVWPNWIGCVIVLNAVSALPAVCRAKMSLSQHGKKKVKKKLWPIMLCPFPFWKRNWNCTQAQKKQKKKNPFWLGKWQKATCLSVGTNTTVSASQLLGDSQNQWTWWDHSNFSVQIIVEGAHNNNCNWRRHPSGQYLVKENSR